MQAIQINEQLIPKDIDYWCELLNSGADQLIHSDYVYSDLVKAMKKKLDQISHDPEAVLHYSFMQAKVLIQLTITVFYAPQGG